MKIKDAVEKALEDDKRCWADTNWFIIKALRNLGISLYIPYGQLKKMPSIETLLRQRRDIQNKENKYHEVEFQEGVSYEPPKK